MRRFNQILFLLATATSAFAQTGFTTRTYTTPQATNVQASDFNHDGHPDLLLTGGPAPLLMTNNGSGSFATPIALTSAPNATLIADLNGDGFPDLIGCSAGTGSQSSVYTYLNDGTGNFSQAQKLAISGTCSGIDIGDVNLDGHLDLVAVSQVNTGDPTLSYNNVIQTFFNDGTGHFGTPTIQPNVNLDGPAPFTNCGAQDTQGGNLFLDNNYSLVITTFCTPANSNPRAALGTAVLAHGDGKGHFTFTTLRTGYEYLHAISTPDINKDGRPDLLFTTSDVFNDASTLYTAINNGGGSFTFSSLNAGLGANLTPIGFATPTVADLNDDGFNDIATVISSSTNGQAATPYISILNGSSSGTFKESQNFQFGFAGFYVPALTVADFNGDGKQDIAAVAYDQNKKVSTLNIYTNTGAASGSGCVKPTQSNVAIICTPAQGATSTSPVSVLATNSVDMVSSRLYLDNVSVYQSTSPTVSTQLTASAGKHSLVYVVYDLHGKAYTASSTFTVGGAGGGCLPSGPGTSICEPMQGATAASPVTITAGAIAQSGTLTALRAYIDNIIVFTATNTNNTSSFQISQSATVTPGSHHLVMVGYQSTGGSVSASRDFVVSGSTPCYPSTAGAKICSPANGSTSASPSSIVAGATASTGYIASIRVYVDNVAKATVPNPQQSKSFAINQSVSLPAGTHHLEIVAYPSTGGSLTTTESITIK